MLYRLLCAAALLLILQPALAVSVLFINPGRTDELYWVAASKSMHMAADSLGMKLEVLYAERNHIKAIELAREIAARPPARRPDYLILSNDYGSAAEILRILAPTRIPVLLAFSGLSLHDAAAIERTRAQFSFWLGSIEPRADEAGYLTARALIERARASGNAAGSDGKLHLIAIAGDRSTTTSIERNRGMQRAVAENDDVVLDQIAYGDWNRGKAEEQARWLFARYPEARLVWAGNDEMAFGAMRTWRELGGKPGTDAWFSAINTSSEAMQALRDGKLAALAGGHFLTGAWAMVMLYDLAHGRDFRDQGTELHFPLFTLFDTELSLRFEERFGAASAPMDFRPYSKVLNPELDKYNFTISALLR